MTGAASDWWTDPKAYEDTRHHAGRDWAWEFLRRNQAYTADWRLVAKGDGRRRPDPNKMTARFLALDAVSRWGVIFRRRSR